MKTTFHTISPTLSKVRWALVVGAMMFCISLGASAQEFDEWQFFYEKYPPSIPTSTNHMVWPDSKPLSLSEEFKVRLIELSDTLNVWCDYSQISIYVSAEYHHEKEDNVYRGWANPKHHECTNDNALAQKIYLARLEMLNSPEIYRNSLSVEVEKIVHNFELLTGDKNIDDGDYIGPLSISPLSLSQWNLWFKKNKDKLRYCPKYHLLYINSLP